MVEGRCALFFKGQGKKSYLHALYSRLQLLEFTRLGYLWSSIVFVKNLCLKLVTSEDSKNDGIILCCTNENM